MKLRNKSGITLVSLIIAIVILSILTSITLVALTKDNGVLLRGQEAKNQAENTGELENDILQNIIQGSE